MAMNLNDTIPTRPYTMDSGSTKQYNMNQRTIRLMLAKKKLQCIAKS